MEGAGWLSQLVHRPYAPSECEDLGLILTAGFPPMSLLTLVVPFFSTDLQHLVLKVGYGDPQGSLREFS